jgi:hypothetical protein
MPSEEAEGSGSSRNLSQFRNSLEGLHSLAYSALGEKAEKDRK